MRTAAHAGGWDDSDLLYLLKHKNYQPQTGCRPVKGQTPTCIQREQPMSIRSNE